MFSDELAVTYPPTGRKQESVFVPSELVDGQPGEVGRVQVIVHRMPNGILCALPTPMRDLVSVDESDLSD